ncbi:hypothetical protein B0T20DRAFT_346306 [Sordaria brevicollis]|uniref:DUF7730 domain-containing protein n=1 Tax=Sordaria brevicollis TaxID=83679 RepID=A0AAE0PK91_SORBR|nr:hypothetical protein B0T20DRAFT_346306 [Sordaria brevicollis]
MSSRGASKQGKTAHSRSTRPRPPRIVTRIQPHRQCANRPPRFWRFLDLPAEVRNMIYSHILTTPPSSSSSHSCSHSSKSSSSPSRNDDTTGAAIDVARVWESHPRFDLSLLLVSKKIHSEAAAILYSKNTFIFLEPCDEHRDLHPEAQDFTRHRSLTWLRTIGPTNASAVRNMHIRIRAERTTSRADPYYPDLILELSKLAPNLHRLALIGEKHALQTKPVQVEPLPPAPFEVAQPPAYEIHWHRQWDPNHVTPLSPWMLYEMRHGLRKFLKLHTLVLAGFTHPGENFVPFSRLINAGKPPTKEGGCVVHVVRKRVASRSCGERKFSTLWNEPAVVDPLGRVLDKKKGRGGDGRQSVHGTANTGGGNGSGSALSLATAGLNAAASTASLVQAVVQFQQVDDMDDMDDDDDEDDDEDYWQDLEALLSDSGGEDDEIQMVDDDIIA